MYLCLFEDEHVPHLFPLVHTRAVYDLRLGMYTLLERARAVAGLFTRGDGPHVLLHARREVAGVTAQAHALVVNHVPGLGVLFLNGRCLVEEGPLLDRLRRAARAGSRGARLCRGLVAAWVPEASAQAVRADAVTRATFEAYPEEAVEGAVLVGRLWHLVDHLRPALLHDYAARTKGYRIYERPGVRVHESAVLAEGERIYLAPGVSVRPGAILNAEGGPIYLDEGVTVMERAVVRGPFYAGPHAQVRVGADVEGSTVGPWCKVGGEVHDSVLHSYANKAHAGFLGHSYVGAWCNLGADVNTSNLRNDYGPVALYDAAVGRFEPSGRQFLGLFLGDHSKAGINAMFNTGTVVGVSCNVYGTGFPPRALPSFSWGPPEEGFTEYRLEKALRVAEAVMARRNRPLTDADRALLARLHEQARPARAALAPADAPT